MVDGTGRRVLADISEYPTPEEIIDKILNYDAAKYYKTNRGFYEKRDKALAAILVICQLRKSEAHRLTKGQFKDDKQGFRLVAVKLSKATRTNKKTGEIIVRKKQYRPVINIPTKGSLGVFGQIIKEYIALLPSPETRLFPFKDGSGYTNQIIGRILGIPPHWERAFGENLLYELFDFDLIAVANYVQVDPRTLSKYIHRTPKKYLKKLR